MLKKLAEKILRLIGERLLLQLEELLNVDLNEDGKIGDGK